MEDNRLLLLKLQDGPVKVIHFDSCELILEEAEIFVDERGASLIDWRRKEKLDILPQNIAMIIPGGVYIESYLRFVPNWTKGDTDAKAD